jgi:hypothetical protein
MRLDAGLDPGKLHMTHVVLTGRNARDDLTEMERVKHPVRSGIEAQVGVQIQTNFPAFDDIQERTFLARHIL